MRKKTRKTLKIHHNRALELKINEQFNLANEKRSRKLWDEVAALKIDPQRIINLIYTCYSNEDNQSMLEADLDYFSKE